MIPTGVWIIKGNLGDQHCVINDSDDFYLRMSHLYKYRVTYIFLKQAKLALEKYVSNFVISSPSMKLLKVVRARTHLMQSVLQLSIGFFCDAIISKFSNLFLSILLEKLSSSR